jgi:hypothetical protein
LARGNCRAPFQGKPLPGLPEAIAVTMRLGHLLDLPQHPYKAVPEPTTTPRNSNVRPGTVSMVSIHTSMEVNQSKPRTSQWYRKSGLGREYTGAARFFASLTVVNFN